MDSAQPAQASKLYVIGVPLNEAGSLSQEAVSVLSKVSVIIGESRKVVSRFLKQVSKMSDLVQIFYLDPPRKDELDALKTALRKIPKGESAALFSDTGMPILFDPGKDVLEFCKEKHFQIVSISGPTSWGSAAALSGFPTPFYIFGFLPQKTEEREKELKKLKTIRAQIVFMDTPYRFRTLLSQILACFGEASMAFLAWELSKPSEDLFWGTLRQIEDHATVHNLEKGEFILILKNA